MQRGALESRRSAIIGSSLEPLLDALETELQPLYSGDVYIPKAKALLSRAGGRCENDGSTLEFDPSSPDRHRCPQCHRLHSGELHHRAWVTQYQLWLAERALHAAIIGDLRDSGRARRLATQILSEYAELYPTYPNRDNVLGPTRLFFSTYLESIWLLQIALAADFMRHDGGLLDRVKGRIVDPSRVLIGEFDEGMSNRQVWNNAARLAAARLVNDGASIDEMLGGPSGLVAHLERALLPDGTWYEGDNYHQFAVRGLWYGSVMARVAGAPVPEALEQRLNAAFRAPFRSALPDFTLPSRKDSQYAVPLRQWRFAEFAELGFARDPHPVLEDALFRCYEGDHPSGDTGRSRSTADVERNASPTRLSRADLNWRALLFAAVQLPRLEAHGARSTLFEHQGLATFRRDPDLYAALDYGQSGGGHGHPDRLNLLLVQGSTRWLDDLGTGSYVDPSLHWYRSTLAHNAPMLDGSSQPLHDGELVAFDEREAIGWIVADLEIAEYDATLRRTLVVAPDYAIDELRWSFHSANYIDIPFHVDPELRAVRMRPAGALYDANDWSAFVHDAQVGEVPAHAPLHGVAGAPGRKLHTFWTPDVPCQLLRMSAPGQPASNRRRFVVFRSYAPAGSLRTVLAWSASAPRVSMNPDVITIETGDEVHRHRRDDSGWHVEIAAGGARSSIDLAGFRERKRRGPGATIPQAEPLTLRRIAVLPEWITALGEKAEGGLTRHLGREHYRRSEDDWGAAGEPSADVAIFAGAHELLVLLHVRAGSNRFTPADATNLFDNEHPDTMGAGAQLYLRTTSWTAAWMVVPEGSGALRLRVIDVQGDAPAPGGDWRETEGGWEARVLVPISSDSELPIDLDVVINETTMDRTRRRGQLVFSGGQGSFVYLRGDRHDMSRLVKLVVIP